MSRGRKWIVAAAVVLLLAAAALWSFLHVGEWLVIEDPIAPADAIVVLSGRMPERAVEAARLYRQNLAPEVWVSRPAGPAGELERMNIAYLGEDFYNQKVLMALGVLPDAIRVFPEPAANTEAELDQIGRMARQSGAETLIVVTSKPHTRRLRLIWNQRVGQGLRLIVRYPPEDSFDAAHWWRRTRDGLDVVREVLGIANAWAGFPARPPR